jgi:xanthine dehydrogenase accessory factor
MITFLSEVCSLLEAGEDIAIVTIALQTGSTPRESGAKMAVRADGSIIGTVGGGLMEANCIELGRALLKDGSPAAAVRTFDLTNEEAAKAAMVCGGRLTVVAERFGRSGESQNTQGLQALRSVILHLEKGCACRLQTDYAWLTAAEPAGHAAMGGREELKYMRPVSHDVSISGGDAPLRDLEAGLDCHEAGCRFTEGFSPCARLYIFGGGHVALPTAQLARTVGFAVTVLDDRAEFACHERFPDSDVRVLPDFESAFAGLHVTPNDFLVIMTRGHMHDRTVLEQALETPARYVGMIGSRRKRDALYDVLRQRGVSEGAIARCHCPIGLSIQAQTPEEIAVSIVAELIQCRAAEQ